MLFSALLRGKDNEVYRAKTSARIYQAVIDSVGVVDKFNGTKKVSVSLTEEMGRRYLVKMLVGIQLIS